MMYEGVLPDSGLGYFAFGFADPNLPESNSATMVGSDVVVAGFLPGAGAGFALDYFMTSKSQCDYGAGIVRPPPPLPPLTPVSFPPSTTTASWMSFHYLYECGT